jgi:regulator of cell morphogenesis and NO signaling
MDVTKNGRKESEMADISVESTLAEVVTRDQSLARELERFGLDYCCGGAKTIAEACASRGLDTEKVLDHLEAASVSSAPAAWSTMGIVELVDHLESTHHRYLWDELPRLCALADKVLSVHGRNHPELIEVRDLVAAIRAELEPHMLKEERVLFPMIRELAQASRLPTFHCGSVRNPIAMMIIEHEEVGEMFARLRAHGGGYVVQSDGCRSYAALFAALAQLEDDTHLHVHKENNVLFPAVERVEARLTS